MTIIPYYFMHRCPHNHSIPELIITIILLLVLGRLIPYVIKRWLDG